MWCNEEDGVMVLWMYPETAVWMDRWIQDHKCIQQSQTLMRVWVPYSSILGSPLSGQVLCWCFSRDMSRQDGSVWLGSFIVCARTLQKGWFTVLLYLAELLSNPRTKMNFQLEKLPLCWCKCCLPSESGRWDLPQFFKPHLDGYQHP